MTSEDAGSQINKRDLSSSTSGEGEKDALKIFRPSKDSYRAIVEDIVDKIYDKERGLIDSSSSYCSSPRKTNSTYSFDQRLKYWNSVLEDRKKLTMKLQKKTGKAPADMLFNYPVSVEERDKSNVKRLLDYADRMDPDALRDRKPLVLRRKCCWCCGANGENGITCKHLEELAETLPKAERDGETNVEIISLPRVTQKEIMGIKKSQQPERRRTNWFTTKAMQRGFSKNRVKLERVLQFYPDIENLQIVGKSLTQKTIIEHDSEIEFIGPKIITEISSDSSICDLICAKDNESKLNIVVERFPYALIINEHLFTTSPKQSPLILDFETRFKCHPYQRVVKRVLHLKNVGTKVINFIWSPFPYYQKRKNLLNCSDNEFYFDKRTFRLIPDEERNIIIEYIPRRFGVTKCKWFLRILPKFFCRKVGRIVIKLKGICRQYPEYEKKLNEYEQTTIFKSNKMMMLKLTKEIAEFTPLLKPDEDICPYKRQLDERELFEALNKGYKCERYHDLLLLKEIYGRLKVPREPAWDFKILTLKNKIFALETSEERAITFNEMMFILDEMKGKPITWEEKLTDTTERDRARFIYVRGVISSAIDEWEEIAYALEDSFYKTAIREYMEALFAAAEEEEEEEDNEEEDIGDMEEFNEKSPEEIREEIWNDLRYNKSFRDALYIDTFTHLCNVIEDIVSIIESTEII